MKKIIIAAIAILAVSTWVIVAFSTQPKQSSGQLASPKPAVGNQEDSSEGAAGSGPTDNQILSALSKKSPNLFSSGSPKFTIVKKQTPLTNWSIVTLRMKDGFAEDQRVIFTQQSINVAPTIVQGPSAELLNLSGLPNEVREALRGAE